MTETDLQRRIILALSQGDTRLFRNNVGAAWQGATFSIVNGRLVSGHARYVVYGLTPGSSDLVGLKSVIITPQMIGRRIAVLSCIEAKGERGRSSDEQRQFIEQMQRLGAIAGVARSEEEAKSILSQI